MIKKKGQTIIGFVVAGAILAVILGAWLLAYANYSKNITTQRAVVSQEALKNYVRQVINCPLVLSPAGTPCTNGTYLVPYNKEGNALPQTAGQLIVGDSWALKFKCVANTTRTLKVEFLPYPHEAATVWGDLFEGIPYACTAPAPPPPPPVAGCVDATATFTEANFLPVMGMTAGAHLMVDGYHANIACDKMGYQINTAFTYVSSTAAMQIGFWRKYNSTWMYVPGSAALRYLSTITCRFPKSVGCECPTERPIGDSGYINVVASNGFTGVNYYNLGKSKCVSTAGVVAGTTNCVGMKPDAATTTKICNLFGFTTVKQVAKADWSSPKDNALAYWTGGANFNIIKGKEKTHISSKKDMICATQMAATCNTWY